MRSIVLGLDLVHRLVSHMQAQADAAGQHKTHRRAQSHREILESQKYFFVIDICGATKPDRPALTVFSVTLWQRLSQSYERRVF
jgi:hypothetical protein